MRSDGLSSFEWLFRLYDVREATAQLRAALPPNVRFRRLRPSDRKALAHLAHDCGIETEEAMQWLALCAARFPLTATGAFFNGKLLAAGFYDVDSRGTSGPLMVSPSAAPSLSAATLAETLLMMHQHGYQYAVEFDVASWIAKEVAAVGAGTCRQEFDPSLPADKRDLDVPFADLFIWLDSPNFPSPFQVEEFEVRVPVSSERELIVDWIRHEFGRGWSSEMDSTFSNDPISSVIAVRKDGKGPPEQRLLGFCCYDSAGIGVSSTIAVHPSVGNWKARMPILANVMLGICREMYSGGYRFCIGAGISRRLIFLEMSQGLAWTIPGSYPGFYRNVVSYK